MELIKTGNYHSPNYTLPSLYVTATMNDMRFENCYHYVKRQLDLPTGSAGQVLYEPPRTWTLIKRNKCR